MTVYGRRQLDFYETAHWQVDALVDYLPELSGSIWCPCVGDGSLMRRLQERRPGMGPFVTNDIDPYRGAEFHGDATNHLHWHYMVAAAGSNPDWVVENPPFDVEIDILKPAYEFAQKGVVFMARRSFTEATKEKKPRKDGKPGALKRVRGPWLTNHPRASEITLERYSFTGNGKTDSTPTCWLVWAKQPIAMPGGHTAFGYKDGWAQAAATARAEAVA